MCSRGWLSILTVQLAITSINEINLITHLERLLPRLLKQAGRVRCVGSGHDRRGRRVVWSRGERCVGCVFGCFQARLIIHWIFLWLASDNRISRQIGLFEIFLAVHESAQFESQSRLNLMSDRCTYGTFEKGLSSLVWLQYFSILKFLNILRFLNRLSIV